jgi:hypothetical protein
MKIASRRRPVLIAETVPAFTRKSKVEMSPSTSSEVAWADSAYIESPRSDCHRKRSEAIPGP